MWLPSSTHRALEDLRGAIGHAGAVTPELVLPVLDLAVARCTGLNRSICSTRVRQLIAAEAWTEAALAIIAFERMRALRRINFEDGEWRCIIGLNWSLPEWLDDTVEAVHEVLALAILGALVEAMRPGPSATWRAGSERVLRAEVGGGLDTLDAVNCDNFS